MKIWVSYLVEQLERYRPICDFSLEGGAEITHVRIFRKGLEPLRGESLYLCLNDIPEGEGPLPPDVYFVVNADSASGHLPNRILIQDPPTEWEVFSLLADSADRFRGWIEGLTRLVLEKSEPRALLAASEEMLVDPVLLLDPSYNMIAVTPSATSADFPYFDFGGTWSPDPEFLFHLEREAVILRQCEWTYSTCRVIRQNDRDEALYKFLYNGDTFANLVMSMSRAPCTPARLDLLRTLCHYLHYVLNVSDLRLVPSGNANFALTQILKFGDDKAMRELLDPRPGWAFMVAMLSLSTDRPTLAGYLSQIQRVLPRCAVCFLDNRIIVVMCVSTKDSESVFYRNQYQRLGLLAEALEGEFGLSYRTPDLSHLQLSLDQARKALELAWAEQGPREERLHFYGSVAAADILGAFFPEEEEMEDYFPPEIAEICRGGDEAAKNTCELIYAYLLTGKSLAGAAELLHMHRSTVAYRLDRLRDTTQINFDDPYRNQLYQLCCLSYLNHKMKQSL